MKESKIQSKVMDYFKLLGAYTLKTMTTSKNGVSDVISCVPVVITDDMVGKTLGLFVASEVKTKEGEPSPLQKYNIKKIRECGGIAGIVRSVDDVKSLLSEQSQ